MDKKNSFINSDYKHEKFYTDLQNFEALAYEKNDMLPRRYVYVLTNLCNLACDYCFQVRKNYQEP